MYTRTVRNALFDRNAADLQNNDVIAKYSIYTSRHRRH